MCQYYALHPSTFRLDGGAMFGIIPKPLWEGKIKPDQLNRIPLSLRVLCFETKNKIILVDTGIGDYHGEKFDQQFDVKTQSQPLSSAAKNKKVTDIILTHLHFDHVGGLGQTVEGKFQPVFPDATIHLSRDHYTYALNPTKRDAGSFQVEFFKPLIEWYEKNNRIHWINHQDQFILKDENFEINFETSMGHTPFQIHPYDNKVIYMGDILPTSHHLSIPWVMGYDISPGVTTEDKERLYEKIIAKNLTVIFEHDPEYWGGQIGLDEKKRFIWKNLFKSSGELNEKLNLQ